ncbi:unnamed protein product (macronuclear) [Paramecium tetraurelia]|uniref:Uncharacterized protein n=1 Tax=Paramecium tetraurelia TaxID=5888 RepID=A0E9K5_PARTE|nr:uncharacterized protein GSPATT00024703001 [Paramecium tetraurelia]CAK91972.1 unnamed protein product [Paramecium tetraurelia]|eukprot:XP_001459369.1 hypothetical protein (macronuclear) [Paramecium tetraurelia strain d4-2]
MLINHLNIKHILTYQNHYLLQFKFDQLIIRWVDCYPTFIKDLQKQADDQMILDMSKKFGFYNELKIMIKAQAWKGIVVNTSKLMKAHIFSKKEESKRLYDKKILTSVQWPSNLIKDYEQQVLYQLSRIKLE